VVAVVTPVAGGRSTAERLAALAGRLTGRDRQLCRLLAEHRVLTTPQLVDLAFGSRNAAEHRLALLHRLGVVDRFRPHRTPGSAPYHYLLGPLGAALLAAQHEQDPAQVGYRRDRTLALAHSQRLQHLLGVNGFFTALARTARDHADAALEVWWSEQRCAARWGQLVRPDGYGRWREHQQRVDFFLEYDRGSEPVGRLAGKLAGYLELAHASGIATPLLLRLPGSAREAAARRALAGSSLPVATASRCGCRCTNPARAVGSSSFAAHGDRHPGRWHPCAWAACAAAATSLRATPAAGTTAPDGQPNQQPRSAV
jgi:Replication-relaxation